jgi:hypothetical protein
MDFDKRDVDERSRNGRRVEDPALLIGRAAVKAMTNSPLMASVRAFHTRIVKGMAEQRFGHKFVQGFKQKSSGLNHQFASLAKRFAEFGPPTTEMVLAAYDASKALSEGDAEPMDRFLTNHLKLPATPENRKLLQNIIDSSFARGIRDVRDHWLVLGPQEGQVLIRQVDRRVRLSGGHKAALLAYGTSSDPRQRKSEELPAVVYYAWSDIQRPGHRSTLVDTVGNYLKISLAGETNTVQFEDMGRLGDVVGRLGQKGKKTTRDGRQLPLQESDAQPFDIQEFELREAVRQDVTALKTLVEGGVLQAKEARTCLDDWAEKAEFSRREAQMYELDMRTGFNTAIAAVEMDVSEKKARDYRSRYLVKLRRAAEL